MIGDTPQLLVGGDDQVSDRSTFFFPIAPLSMETFETKPDAQRFEAFLVIASKKGDALSLFETKGRLL
jgi:hypothetical protein